MSDAVFCNLEEMVDELNYYKKHNIFDDKKIQDILERRKSYEYKIIRSKKLITDFLNYINYEKRLEAKIIQLTKEKYHKFIIKRISSIYRRALRHFNSPEIISTYIKFLEKREQLDGLFYFFEFYTKRNPQDIDFVIFAAEKCIKYNEYNKGRVLLLRGVRENNVRKMHIALCSFEIEYMKHCIKMNEDIGLDKEDYGDVEKGYVVFAVIKNYVEKYGNCAELNAMCENLDVYDEIYTQITDITNK